MTPRIGAIIQARLGSTRLPEKVFYNIEGKPLIWHIINRLSGSIFIDKIILATTTNIEDDKLQDWAIQNKVDWFRGDEDDVLGRFYKCAIYFNIDIIVRITADDPFKDYHVIDDTIRYFKDYNLDFASNNNPPSYPEGLDVEVFSMRALQEADENSKDSFEREHVTQYFYKNPTKFRMGNLEYSENISHLRWTIDTIKDLEMARKVYSYLFAKNNLFSFQDILGLLEKYPEIAEININENRSTMYQKK